MWRQTACAVGGLILVCAAVYGVSSISTQSSAENFDLRWLYPASKGDRLPVGRMTPADDVVMAFNVPSAGMTIAAKGPTMTQAERRSDQIQRFTHTEQSAQVRVRTIPVNPVRTVPKEEKRDTKDKERLPVGCEPAFSPVTTPAMAHISSRCDA